MSFEELLMTHPEYAAQKLILLYIPPILLVVGTFGNLFSFIILLKNTRKASTYSYLSVLAIMDLLVLYIGLMKLWIAQFMINVEEVNRVFCKTAVFLGYMCSEVSVWLIVAVTIERTIVVLFPLKAPRICNAKYAKIGIISIIVLFTAVNLHFLWSVDLHYTHGNNTVVAECRAKENFKYLVEHFWPWVDAALYSFSPFVFIFVLNLFIIRNVINANNARMMLRQHSSLSGRSGTQVRQRQDHGEVSRRITCMLLAVSFTFLITTLPMNIYIIYTSVTETPQEIGALVKRKLIDTISEMLMYTNHSINFFLYCATGKKFRSQMLKEENLKVSSSVLSSRERRI
ncbi:probable G-protein coupled receptor 139 [Mya arenaria]|uniref:probable G-protein coupled receptor 139 n=1 Tax=Mya arenaria TaxID=6604 RepID=UPI0022E1F889|nr:probable G-protein coupled receptor 139 [Mya arenaria]